MLIKFLFFPNKIEIINKVSSCVVNALVEATPISGPAKVNIFSSDNLEILLSKTLTIEIVFNPCFLASSRPAKVSRVSPDCEINITTSPSVFSNFLYLYSEAISTLTLILANSSNQNLAILQAKADVPHAIKVIFLISVFKISLFIFIIFFLDL